MDPKATELTPAQTAPAAPHLDRLRYETELLMEELSRRVKWVRAIPERVERSARAHVRVLTWLGAGLAGIAAGGLALYLIHRRERNRPLRRATAKVRSLGHLVAHADRVGRRPSLGRLLVRRGLATLVGAVVGQVARVAIKRLLPSGADRVVIVSGTDRPGEMTPEEPAPRLLERPPV